MRKIPTLFVRDEENRARVTPVVTSDLSWVLERARATAKWDGTAVLWDHQAVWKRRELREGDICPETFRQASEPDPVTGKIAGWVKMAADSPEDRWLYEAVKNELARGRPDYGTYELVGPKVQGNPHGLAEHRLIAHGEKTIDDPPRSYQECQVFLVAWPYEGIVWWDENGPVAKIKRRDFGYPWPARNDNL